MHGSMSSKRSWGAVQSIVMVRPTYMQRYFLPIECASGRVSGPQHAVWPTQGLSLQFQNYIRWRDERCGPSHLEHGDTPLLSVTNDEAAFPKRSVSHERCQLPHDKSSDAVSQSVEECRQAGRLVSGKGPAMYPSTDYLGVTWNCC